jgi:peroxiredoxin
MARSDNLHALPPDLPVPVDDGGCAHLTGLRVPSLVLAGTDGATVDLSALPGTSVVYAYPRTGRPDEEPPDGWNQIPGARGCTPESCGFRDHFADLRAVGARVFGFSTQTTDYQREAVERLHLPFPILSDADLRFVGALRLPTFDVAGMTLVKRLTLVLDDGLIAKVFYPVFPPDAHADEVLAWLRARPRAR